ncbi:phosphatidylinositol alpha-1,6-mannosyltransferase [Motilibacter rhizosphaerae]|uniref:Phosphatidylinositol alpha-1,6-mannosyltransferase n=2 Tax=Motilibacter rhizosphaerae TaxID=598652 RepID=A0A4Q7NQJ2_9ACTN|nr:glycosyltransferase family 4 protein [Motilibacter rhizosphaerae]RZS87368.1 phosphatidylinositol alpha-1,6-mannosyltransferase [Motilibacter rhizosphaerae]
MPSSSPRVLLLTPVFPPARGGIETLSLQMSRHLGECALLVVTAEQDGWREWDAGSGLTVERVANVPRGGRKTQLRLTAAAVTAARRFKPDITVSMHVRLGPAAEAVRALTKCRWVQYYHAKEVPTWRRQAGWCAKRADAHIAVSRYTADLVERAGGPRDRVAVVPPGIDLPSGGVTAKRGGPPRLLTISRLADSYKGHDVVLEALPALLEEFPDLRWDVVGDGPLRESLERRASSAGTATAVSFRGSVSDDERDELLGQAHVFVMPSRVSEDGKDGEGFGITYVEAAAHGVPVVAAAEGGALDAVADGRTGLLVDPRDPAAVAGAVGRILRDEDERLRMAEAGIDWAKGFSWERVAAATRSVLFEGVGAR